MNKRLLVGICAVAALGAGAPAEAKKDTPKYTSLTVFGDSLVDAGNIRALGFGANPAQGYYMGRFTNGYDYTDLISLSLFGTVTTPSLRGGTNFAYGGARASNTTPIVPDLGEQLALFTAAARPVDPNGLYVLNFGGNDIFNAPSDPTAKAAFLQQSARDYANGVQFLADRGVRNILLTGFPVLTDSASRTAEGYLTTELARVTLAPDATLFRFSYLDFFQRVLDDPGALGLPAQARDVTCQQAGAAAIANNCAGIFSFDGTHPTAPIQEALFRELNRQFDVSGVPEPATWGTLIVGFGLIGGAMRRRRTTMATAAREAL